MGNNNRPMIDYKYIIMIVKAREHGRSVLKENGKMPSRLNFVAIFIC